MARTLRIRSITPGKMVGGRFIPNARKKVNASKLGSGARFRKCVAEVTARGGAQDPNAVCGAAGTRKYGKKRMEKWAHKRRNPGDKEINVLVPHRGSIGGIYAYRTVARTIKEAKREAAQAAGYSRVPKGTKAHVIRTYNPKRKRKSNRRRK